LPINPHVNLRLIRFTTDNLTLGDVRELRHKKFARIGKPMPVSDADGNEDFVNPLDPIKKAIQAERRIAKDAYTRAKAWIRRDPDEDENRRQLCRLLADFYIQSGLASNHVHATALISDIETQAEQQALIHRAGPWQRCI
jgi:hypothetical protein